MNLKCTLCGTVADCSNFYKNKLMLSGYANQCKECVKARARSNPNNRKSRPVSEARKNSMRKYSSKYPNKASAHNAVEVALKRGSLVKGACEVCGDINSFAHHDDYLKPMVVRWLCRKHHAEWHRNNGEGLNGK